MTEYRRQQRWTIDCIKMAEYCREKETEIDRKEGRVLVGKWVGNRLVRMQNIGRKRDGHLTGKNAEYWREKRQERGGKSTSREGGILVANWWEMGR